MVLQNAYIKVEMLIQKQFKHTVFSIKPQQSTKTVRNWFVLGIHAVRKRY